MNKELDTRNFATEQLPSRMLEDGSLAVGQTIVTDAADALNKEYLAELAFMEEEIEIMLHESSDPNAEPVVPVGVNGQFKYLKRGEQHKLKRKFVNQLFGKQDSISTPEFTNQMGERVRGIKRMTAQKYPFSVVFDPNPKGAEWVRRGMAQGA